MTATTQPDSSTRTPAQEPAPTSAEVPAPTAPTADLPRNLVRLTARAEAAGWTTTVETQPGHCALLLTARQETGETVLRCVWRLTARGYRWDGATLARNGQQAAEGIAWRALGDLVAAEAPTARTAPVLSAYGERGAAPVTAEVVSASIAATPTGEVPVMLRPWTKATIPFELYPSRFVGRAYVGADCLLAPEGDDAAPDAQPVLSVLPSDYLTSNAAYLEDLAAYAVAESRTDEEGAAFARWVVSSEIMTFGVYGSAYEAWVRSLTCTMTARYAVLTYTRMNGAALRLECGCGQRHTGRPWEGATVWNDEGRHYPSTSAVPLDHVADLITARGYQVAGEWSPGDVVRRVAVEPTALPQAETTPTVTAADAPPSDPGTADAWESDGGACPGAEPPQGPEPAPETHPAAIAQMLLSRAVDAYVSLLRAVLGDGTHRLVASASTPQGDVADAQSLTLHGDRVVSDRDASMRVAIVIAAGMTDGSTGELTVRTVSPDGSASVRAWAIQHGWLHPLTANQARQTHTVSPGPSGQPAPASGMEYRQAERVPRPAQDRSRRQSARRTTGPDRRT